MTNDQDPKPNQWTNGQWPNPKGGARAGNPHWSPSFGHWSLIGFWVLVIGHFFLPWVSVIGNFFLPSRG
jgi:hypothetical protein